MISQLRQLSIKVLSSMYRADRRLFVFRVKRSGGKVVSEGLSYRYTAITLIGLAGEKDDFSSSVLREHSISTLCDQLKHDLARSSNLGDVALALWAAKAVDYPDLHKMREQIVKFHPAKQAYPTVEVSWTLDALCKDLDGPFDKLREEVARRLKDSFNRNSGVFPHILGGSIGNFRSHVSCFADMVYPIHALSNYSKLTGDGEALEMASLCAEKICELQGPDGQWWWHYDYRTGQVIERYPVYSVHQDAMAPMAMFALKDAGGPDFSDYVQKGLQWLAFSPEIQGSLIDERAGFIWRKVARRELRKLSRYVQTVASKIHPSLRFPSIDIVFPPTAVDYECRPYHLGWLLYAWRETQESKANTKTDSHLINSGLERDIKLSKSRSML